MNRYPHSGAYRRKAPWWLFTSLALFAFIYGLSKLSYFRLSTDNRQPSSLLNKTSAHEVEVLQVHPRTDKADEDEPDPSTQIVSLFDIESQSKSLMADGIKIHLSAEIDKKSKQLLYIRLCDNFDGDQMKPNKDLRERDFACSYLSYENLLKGEAIIEGGPSGNFVTLKAVATHGLPFDSINGGTLKITLGHFLLPSKDLRSIDISLRKESSGGLFKPSLYTQSKKLIPFNRIKLNFSAVGKHPSGILTAEFLEQSRSIYKSDLKRLSR
jgi:hypothetical protein